MLQSKVKTYRYRIGQKQFIVIKIYQTARASAKMGNALASNALNIQIFKKQKKRKKR
ncbi:hypothetical protein ACFPES_10505 [Paenibacillus sp. GCM10023248]|uniref:hypothetical protein n=1 Tax=Bacillales TaxID=1385 RepID=UPI002379F94A|nr:MULTISPECIES: hypothetical protein [Bacillales]MDD9267453.1 hypothetical protein [Paenibacillus sp. MAHUQ-63]MDR6882671.1 hypothetical protein [Bacillus sp. 3255]